MTDLDSQIFALKSEIVKNKINATRQLIHEEDQTISGLEFLLESGIGGDRRAEAFQLLKHLKLLIDLEKQNIHQVFTFNKSSKYGTFKQDFTIINGIQSPSVFELEDLFNAWLKEKEAGILEPTPEPTPELLSANIKISFTDSNIGGFSSSIPINDIDQLQGIMNDDYKNKAKYTLIGSSTNQPISTLSGVINNINNLLASVEPEPEPEPDGPDILITNNMITQKIDYFTIEDNRIKGQLTFIATQNFNPYYYNKVITSYVQFSDRVGTTLLIKQNNLRFTETERDETIQFDEAASDNILLKADSFVWIDQLPFSKVINFEITEKEPVKPLETGFMGAGGLGAVAVLILIGAAFTIKGD